MKLATGVILFAAGVALVLGTSAPSHSNPPAVGYGPQAHAGAVVVPYYGATYGGPAGISASDGKRVVELLESIDRRLEQLEAKTGAAPLAVKKGPELLAVAKQRCAACHTEARADAKGGGFILFADDKASALKPLSAGEKTRVKQAVQGGTMPPAAKLTADEKAAFKW